MFGPTEASLKSCIIIWDNSLRSFNLCGWADGWGLPHQHLRLESGPGSAALTACVCFHQERCFGLFECYASTEQQGHENVMKILYLCSFHVFIWGRLVSSSLNTDVSTCTLWFVCCSCFFCFVFYILIQVKKNISFMCWIVVPIFPFICYSWSQFIPFSQSYRNTFKSHFIAHKMSHLPLSTHHLPPTQVTGDFVMSLDNTEMRVKRGRSDYKFERGAASFFIVAKR